MEHRVFGKIEGLPQLLRELLEICEVVIFAIHTNGYFYTLYNMNTLILRSRHVNSIAFLVTEILENNKIPDSGKVSKKN